VPGVEGPNGTIRGVLEAVEERAVAPLPARDEARADLRATFVDLYESQFAPMVRLAVALTGSEPAAEDIVHDAFVRVHSHWRRVEHPNAYLRTAVVNACRSAARRAARERTLVSGQVAEVVTLRADEMFDALDTLPYRQRAALVLYYYEGLTHAEIADVLRCREGTVASLIHRGLAQLKRVIER
jgi:RNA polymerase sigma factor (sigma-70 family)